MNARLAVPAPTPVSDAVPIVGAAIENVMELEAAVCADVFPELVVVISNVYA